MAMKFYTEAEALDKVIGTKETTERIEFDAQMDLVISEKMVRKMKRGV